MKADAVRRGRRLVWIRDVLVLLCILSAFGTGPLLWYVGLGTWAPMILTVVITAAVLVPTVVVSRKIPRSLPWWDPLTIPRGGGGLGRAPVGWRTPRRPRRD